GARALIERLAAFPERHPIVVWSSPAWSDQLQLFWVLDAAERGGIDPKRLRLAEPRGAHAELGLGAFNADQIREAIPRARPLDRPALREGAKLWRLFAADSPEGFDAARRRGSRRFPHLAKAAEDWGRYFPRRGKGG